MLGWALCEPSILALLVLHRVRQALITLADHQVLRAWRLFDHGPGIERRLAALLGRE